MSVCPHCHKKLKKSLLSEHLSKLGTKGGSVTGPSKRRDVDYVELGRLGAAARKAKEAK
jgi:hypothetical protein